VLVVPSSVGLNDGTVREISDGIEQTAHQTDRRKHQKGIALGRPAKPGHAEKRSDEWSDSAVGEQKFARPHDKDRNTRQQENKND
jgi:hypothetical protein